MGSYKQKLNPKSTFILNVLKAKWQIGNNSDAVERTLEEIAKFQRITIPADIEKANKEAQ